MRAIPVLLVAAIGLGLPNSQAPRVALLTGIVSDASGAPVSGAEVALPALTLSTHTNDSGRFKFADVPAGSHELRVRRIGSLEFIDVVSVPESGTIERRITLRPVQTLAPVDVVAEANMREFEENRRIGLGKFLTRAELEKMEHRKLPEILEAVGAKAYRIGSHAWVGTSRSVRSFTGAFQKCTELEGKRVDERDRNNPNKNPGCGCWAQVWLDDAMLFSGDERGVVPDLNRIVPTSIEAVEFYKSSAQTPLKYSRLNSQCGVLVLHTRRHGAPKPPR